MSIRRLGCTQCNRIHHELPDMLVPYKRHVRESIEAVVNGEEHLTVTADESTLRRWRNWFSVMADYFQGCLKSITIFDMVKNLWKMNPVFPSPSSIGYGSMWGMPQDGWQELSDR